MSRGTMLAVGCLAISSVLMLVLYLRDHAALGAARRQQDAVCRRLATDLETLVKAARRNARDHELRAKLVHHHLDPALAKLCLGSELPLDASDADACWIGTGRDACYLDTAEALLRLHEARRRD